MDTTHKRTREILFTMIGAIVIMGLSGTVSDLLFNQRQINVDWYVTARLLISGIFLLIFYKILQPKHSIFIIFRNVKTVIHLLIYSLLGMLFVQYAYMDGINCD